MAKARKRRESEVQRLRGDPQVARQIEAEDDGMPRPQSSGPFLAEVSIEAFRDRWRKPVGLAEGSSEMGGSPGAQGIASPGPYREGKTGRADELPTCSARTTYQMQPSLRALRRRTLEGWTSARSP